MSATQKAGWIRRLIGWIRPHRRDAIVAFSVAIVGTAIAAFAPLVEKVIVDDVITTGSTVAELKCVLLAAGVGRVDVWAVASAAQARPSFLRSSGGGPSNLSIGTFPT